MVRWGRDGWKRSAGTAPPVGTVRGDVNVVDRARPSALVSALYVFPVQTLTMLAGLVTVLGFIARNGYARERSDAFLETAYRIAHGQTRTGGASAAGVSNDVVSPVAYPPG